MKALCNPMSFLTARGLRSSLIACVVAGCGLHDADAPEPPEDTGSATSALAARPVDPGKVASLQARAKDLVRAGSIVQTESRLGVPTFLWTADKRVRPSRASWLAAGAAQPEVDASRAVLADYAALYGLTDDDVADAVVAGIDSRAAGPVLVKLHTQVGGIEIFGEQLNVVMNHKLEPVAITGYLTSAATPPARPGGLAFDLAARAGATTAIDQLANTKLDASLAIPAGSHGGYDYFALSPAAGVALEEPVRVKRVYFHLPDGLEAAYYVEVIARTGAAPAGMLTADGSPLATSEAYAYVVSAVTGQVLFRKSLIAEAVPRAPRESNALDPSGFTYRVWADPVTGIPLDTPAGNTVHPKLTPTPDGAQATFVGTSDVRLPNFPFSRSLTDPWLPPGATETVGNNTDAFLNLLTPDGYGNPTTTTPADPATADFRAQITAAGQFLHGATTGNSGFAEGRQGAIQQLFYDLNFLHDWYYDSGFNEAAGNAQTNNFGRGGNATGDSIKAQVQDFQSFSNANMLTPADGGRPRMRMYMFPSLANMLDVQAPAGIAGKLHIGISMSGPQALDLTADMVIATFSNSPTSCTVTNAPALAGKLAMFNFDNTDGTGCSFSTRIARLTTGTTAAAIVLVYTSASPTVVANITGYVAVNTRPVVTISWNSGQLIKGQIGTSTVTARLLRDGDRDGSLDNQIVFHEFFHYVSNRLVANGSGLATNLASGMGEGWSDFNSMMLTVRADDTATPSNTTFNGAYGMATYATSGVPLSGANHGYYFGIRRYPYSTAMSLNPLTFKHITDGIALPVGPPVAFGANGATNSEVHNTGEVWTTMLWECYAALLRDTQGAAPRLTFQVAQDRMKQYLISSLKVTPSLPTITEARDALLAVALANDPTDYRAFKIAFAKRGAGSKAVSPDRFSINNAGVVEDFTTGADLTFESATIDDSLGPCDIDGAVDHGEYGRLTITLRNTGTIPLAATTAAISTASTDVWYPLGHIVRFPATLPGASATASLRFAYVRTVSGIQQLDFRIDYTDAQLGGTQTKVVGFRTNTDELPATTATDTVEPVSSPWTRSFNPVLGNVAPWQRLEITPLQHLWHVDDPNAGSDQYLTSPVMTIDGSGSFNVQFDHSWSFEFDGGGSYDGGVIEASVNGGAFTDIGATLYNGTIVTYTGGVNPLQGRAAFVQASGGTLHGSLTQAIAPGSTAQIRFRSGSDSVIGAAGWNVDNIAFTGVVETPFATVVADGDICTVVPTSADLAITVTDGVTSVTAGGSVTYTITASNVLGGEIIGAAVADNFPSELSCNWTCTGGGAAVTGIPSGTCTASGSGNILDLVTLPVGGSVTYTASCAVSAVATNLVLSNTAKVTMPPGPVTDLVPANNTATDTDTVVHLPAHLTGSKTVAGDFVEGGTVTYTIELTNDGGGHQFDNAGDELTDVLPAGLTLTSADASSGTTVATLGTNTVTWNGEIAPNTSATITIAAVIIATAGTTVSNQASFKYDGDGDFTNEATGTTDAFVCTGHAALAIASPPP